MAAKKYPAEERVLKLLKDGLSDKEAAAKAGTNPNHGVHAADRAQHRRDQAHVRRTVPSPARVGRAMLDQLIEAARTAGYERIRLDKP
jgi:hypothetical protein